MVNQTILKIIKMRKLLLHTKFISPLQWESLCASYLSANVKGSKAPIGNNDDIIKPDRFSCT